MKITISILWKKKMNYSKHERDYYYNTNRCSKKYNFLCHNRIFNNLVQFQIRVHIDRMCM